MEYKMRIGILVTGILVIIGAVIEHAITLQVKQCQTLTNHMVTRVLSTMYNTRSIPHLHQVLQLNSNIGHNRKDR